jgi:hypothetical protein
LFYDEEVSQVSKTHAAKAQGKWRGRWKDDIKKKLRKTDLFLCVLV